MKLLYLTTQVVTEDQLFTNSDLLKVELATFEQLLISFQNHKPIKFSINSQPLQNYSGIYFRKIGENIEQATLISEFANQNSIRLFDSVFGDSRPWIDRKSFEYLRLSKHTLPLINSFFIHHSQLETIIDGLRFPCVAKNTRLNQGTGVSLCSNLKELQIVAKTYDSLLVQEYVPNSGDVRLFVIGNKVVSSMKRSTITADFRNNIAQGARASTFTPSPELEQIAILAAKTLNYDIAGVDAVFDDADQTWKILEVNRSPGFAGIMATNRIDIPSKMVEYFLNELSSH